MKGTISKKINFHTTNLQMVYNEWEGREVPIRFAGNCVVCTANTYQVQEENGNWMDPDPRGMVGYMHSSASLEARDYSMTGQDVPVCYRCRDNSATYQIALAIAKGQWGKVSNER